MKSLIIAAALAATSAGFVSSVDAAPVRTQAFQIDVPKEFRSFEKRTEEQKSPEGTIATTIWVAKDPSTGDAIVVSVSKMPGRILNTKNLFDHARDGLAGSLKASVESEETVDSAVAARRVLLHSPGAFVRARLMASDDRFFQFVYVARAADRRASPDVSAMFASVEILPESPATIVFQPR